MGSVVKRAHAEEEEQVVVVDHGDGDGDDDEEVEVESSRNDHHFVERERTSWAAPRGRPFRCRLVSALTGATQISADCGLPTTARGYS